MKKIFNGYPSTFLTCTYFEYSNTFKIKVLVHVLEYLELVLVPNTAAESSPRSTQVRRATEAAKPSHRRAPRDLLFAPSVLTLPSAPSLLLRRHGPRTH